MSKKTDERATPQSLFDQLNTEFKFDKDLAATAENAKLSDFYSIENSALKHNWQGSNFCNPPYSEIYKWLEHGSKQNALIVFILPCDTSTKWFHDFLWDNDSHNVKKGISLRFPKGRFKFGKSGTSPKFATIIAIMDNLNGRLAE